MIDGVAVVPFAVPPVEFHRMMLNEPIDILFYLINCENVTALKESCMFISEKEKNNRRMKFENKKKTSKIDA